MIKLVDVLDNDENSKILYNFIEEILNTDNHRNIHSYKIFLNSKDLKKFYYRLTMLMIDDEVISLQGIRFSQPGHSYGKNICRICDRHYVNKKYRANFNREPYYTKYCLASDIDFLKNNYPEVDTVFVSMEGERAKKHFERRQLQHYKSIGFDFNIDNYFYQTCGNRFSKKCWQTCIYYNIKNMESKLDLPKIDYEQWMRKI